MSAENAQNWLGIVAAGLLWFGVYEFSGRTSVAVIAAAGSKREQAAAAISYGMLRPVFFAIVWTLLYAANSVATFFYWRDGTTLSLYWPTLAIVLANVVVNKAWTAIFVDARMPRLALATLVVNIALAITLLVLVAIDANAAVTWWPFALFMPYTLWLLVAAFLNWRFVQALNALHAQRTSRPQYGMPPTLPRQ